MRRFSEKEKRIIVLILKNYEYDPYSYLLVNAYQDIFYSRRVKFKYGGPNTKQFLSFYRNVNSENIIADVFEIENHIMEVSLLLEYLETNHLIFLIDTSADNVLDEIGGFEPNENENEVRVPLDSNIANILFRSMNHRIYIGETLKSIVENNFRTIEDKLLEEAQTQSIEAHKQSIEAANQSDEAKKQTKFSFIAIILSIISIICSILVPEISPMDVKLTDDQYNGICNKVEDNIVCVDSADIQQCDSMANSKKTFNNAF